MAKGELFSVGSDLLSGHMFGLVLCARQVKYGVDYTCRERRLTFRQKGKVGVRFDSRE